MATMTRQDCIEAVRQAVVSILADFNLPTKAIGPSTVPHKIKQFDSPIGIFGTVMASAATGINVPLDESIFCEKKSKRMRSIAEAADRLMELQAEQARSTRSLNGEVGVAS